MHYQVLIFNTDPLILTITIILPTILWQVLPPTVRGVILGCALRCEGGFEPMKLLDKLTERCVTLAENHKSNIMKGQPQPDKTNEAKNLKEKLTDDIQTLEKEKYNLKQLEQELEAARRKVQRDESAINDAQACVDEKRREIKAMENQNETGKKRDELIDEIKEFERDMQQLASEQQKFATEKLKEEIAKQRDNEEEAGIKRFSQHIFNALQLFGTSRVAALVIGFDMESDGISSALLRVFQRVRKLLQEGSHLYCIIIIKRLRRCMEEIMYLIDCLWMNV